MNGAFPFTMSVAGTAPDPDEHEERRADHLGGQLLDLVVSSMETPSSRPVSE